MHADLQELSDRFSHRFALRRRMLKRLGIPQNPDLAERLQPEIRRSVMACAACGNTDVCGGWLDQGGCGAPVFCRARAAFAELAVAVGNAEGASESAPDVAWVSDRLRSQRKGVSRGTV